MKAKGSKKNTGKINIYMFIYIFDNLVVLEFTSVIIIEVNTMLLKLVTKWKHFYSSLLVLLFHYTVNYIVKVVYFYCLSG